MKGQHVVISELFIFSLCMGLALFIYVFFNNAVISIEKNIEKLQAETVLKELRFLLTKLHFCKKNELSCEFRFSFPKKLGNEIYLLTFGERNISVIREKDYKHLAKEEIPYNITLKGIILSSWREAIVGYSYQNNKVYIRR